MLYAILCLLWIGFGLIGRDPWKPVEIDFVVIIAEFIGALPNLPDEASPREIVSLYLLLAATMGWAFFPLLEIHEGARLINVLMLAGGLVCIGFATRTCHGGRAGWMAALLAMGTAGFMIRAHLLNTAVPAFFGMAVLVWAMTRLRRHALVGGMMVGLALGFLFVAASPTVAVAGAVGSGLTLCHHNWRRPSHVIGLAIVPVFFAPWVLLWVPTASMLSVTTPFYEWLLAGFTPRFSSAVSLLRVAAWALFPVLPAALAVLWLRRHTLPKEPMPFFCLTLAVAGFVHFGLYGDGEEDLFLLLPPLAVFAACGLSRLPDNYAVILDRFALGVVGLGAVGGMWIIWLIVQTGFPAALADSIREKIAFFPFPAVAWWKVVVAACITLLWVGLAANFDRSNERAVLNWSAGITALWSVFNLLAVDIVDAGKSYRRMAVAVTSGTQSNCFTAQGIDASTLGQLVYFGAPLRTTGCDYVLQPTALPSIGTAVWRGGRYSEKNYTLYLPATQTP
jgi:hypothetical protein